MSLLKMNAVTFHDGVTRNSSVEDVQNSARQLLAGALHGEGPWKFDFDWSSIIAETPAKKSRSRSDDSSLVATNAKTGKSDRYKTELCRQFSENGICRYADKCQFAHGAAEMRTVARHPKYKTNLCRTFHSTGFCPYGSRCHFVHGEMSPTDFASPAKTATLPSRMMPSLPLEQLQYSTRRVLPSLESWPSVFYHGDLMGSTSTSPTLSCSDSPVPSPTSMLPEADIWTSIANLIGIGL